MSDEITLYPYYMRSPSLSLMWQIVYATDIDAAYRLKVDGLARSNPKIKWDDPSGWEITDQRPDGSISDTVMYSLGGNICCGRSCPCDINSQLLSRPLTDEEADRLLKLTTSTGCNYTIVRKHDPVPKPISFVDHSKLEEVTDE